MKRMLKVAMGCGSGHGVLGRVKHKRQYRYQRHEPRPRRRELTINPLTVKHHLHNGLPALRHHRVVRLNAGSSARDVT